MKCNLFILALVLTLAGCTTTKVYNVDVKIPDEKFVCADAPEKPQKNRIDYETQELTYMESDIARYFNDYKYAHADCKNQLGEVGDIYKRQKELKPKK